MKKESILLSFSKGTRSFIFSMIAILTPYYLSSLNVSVFYIGVIIFINLTATAIFVLFYNYLKIGVKVRILVLSVLMVLSFIIIYLTNNVIFYVIALIIGGISLSGRDLSAYQPIEQYSISKFEPVLKKKNFAFSIYNFGSYAAAAIAAGTLFLYSFSNYKLLFIILAILSVIQMIPYLIVKFPEYNKTRIKTKISQDTKKHVYVLSSLFALDSIGGGMISTSLLTLWFKYVYNISLASAGLIFIIVNILTAVSIIISSRISGKIGLIRTMVYTHLISNIFLILMPVYHYLIFSEIFLYLKQTTSQMDVPARDSFLNTIIPEDDRVKTNSVFTSVRTTMQIPSPLLGALLIEIYPPALLFFSGGIKVLYDLLLYVKYRWYND